MKTNTGDARLAAVAMMASLFLVACGSVSNTEKRSPDGATRASTSPQLKPDYLCQSMHVRLPGCPSR